MLTQSVLVRSITRRFARSFRPLAPSIPNLLSYHTARQSQVIMALREDTFAQLLSFANIRSGGRYLVVDDCSGLVVGGILERMGGQSRLVCSRLSVLSEHARARPSADLLRICLSLGIPGKGRIMTFSDTDAPPAHNILNAQMNVPKDVIETTVKSLNWAEAEEDWTAPGTFRRPQIRIQTVQIAHRDAFRLSEGEKLAPRAPHQPGEATQRLDRERSKIKRKLAIKEALEATREELFLGEWDG